MVRAMIEAARSTPRKQKPILSSSRAVNEYIGTRFNAEQREHFMVLAVNARNKLLHEFEVAIGCLTGCLVHPREVFRPAVRVAAAAVILVHNHPSGDPTPSPEDVQLTDRLSEAGRILGIRVLDHVVVATDGYCSVMNGR
jgi:DNA repair protein RadC